MRMSKAAAPLILCCTLAGALVPGPALAQPVPGKVIADVRGKDAPGGWDYAAVDREIGALLIARSSGIDTFGLADNRFGPTLAQGHHLHQALPLPGKRILSTDGDSKTASIIDATSGAVITTLRTGDKPDAAILDPADGSVLVMNGESGSITRIAAAATAPRVAGTIEVGGGLETPALDGNGRLFVNIEDRNQIAVVALASGQVTARYPLAGCDGPTGLVYDPDRRLLISSCANGVAKILHDDGSEAATLKIGKGPDAVLADLGHGRVFIPSGGDATLSEIALDGTPHVTRQIATRPGARTGALDPDTQRVYLPYGKVIRAAGRPSRLVPGSFGVLVLDVR